MSPKKKKLKGCFQRPHIRSVVFIKAGLPALLRVLPLLRNTDSINLHLQRERVTEGNNSERERFGEAEISIQSHTRRV